MTLSRHTPPKAELVAPAGTQVIDQNGSVLPTWSEGSKLYFSPKYGGDK